MSAPLTRSMMETSLWSRSASPDSMRIYDVQCCSKMSNANKQNMFHVTLKGHRRRSQLSDIFVQQQLRREHGEVPPGSQDHHARQVFSLSQGIGWKVNSPPGETSKQGKRSQTSMANTISRQSIQFVDVKLHICIFNTGIITNTQKLSATVKSYENYLMLWHILHLPLLLYSVNQFSSTQSI